MPGWKALWKPRLFCNFDLSLQGEGLKLTFQKKRRRRRKAEIEAERCELQLLWSEVYSHYTEDLSVRLSLHNQEKTYPNDHECGIWFGSTCGRNSPDSTSWSSVMEVAVRSGCVYLPSDLSPEWDITRFDSSQGLTLSEWGFVGINLSLTLWMLMWGY